jgi:hypothetical protein
MKIYDYGVFWSHLELEVQKAKRYGYTFSVLMIQSPKGEGEGLVRTLIGTGFRMTDVTAQLEDGSYAVLLNATREKGARKLIERIEHNAPSLFDLRYLLTEYQEDDTAHTIFSRVSPSLKNV